MQAESAPALWDVPVRGALNTGKCDCYVPRVLLKRLVAAPEDLVQTLAGTMVFVDVSGFTRLSERLARGGREGAEHLTDAINACFSALLADAYANGGSLLKFGGDALLLWFDGDDHPRRACASAAAMRSTIRRVGRITAAGSQINLRMSAGVHSGNFQTFLVGKSHREYLIAGPSSSRVVEMEAAASAGQVLLSAETAAMLPRRALGATAGPGVLLARSLLTHHVAADEEIDRPDDDEIMRCLSTEVRGHVLAAPAAPEHRTAVVAFVQFGGLDELIKAQGSAAAARALDALVEAVQVAADLFQVCFLGSDVAAGGGKLILTAGAPRAVGDDEERMLLTLRHIVEQPRELPVRIGVNRGRVFAGEIGPHYRRTYSVMGDTVNLAARLMAKAPWESVYATDGVLSRSQTKFELIRLEPFMVKGKKQPIEAWQLGPLVRPVATDDRSGRVPLIGRDTEYAALRSALAEAEGGKGSLIEIIGETGSGKSRLLAEARDLAGGRRFAHTTCENYRRSVPYVVWRDILRQLLGLHWDDPDEVVTAAILEHLGTSGRELRPWLPLLAIPFDVRTPMTRQVSDLAPEYRTTKLHEVVLEFLEPLLTIPTLIQIEHSHFMDEASAALLHAIARRVESSEWVITVTRRDVVGGFVGREDSATRLVLGPLPTQAMRALAESTPEASSVPPHLLELAVERAGGSPEFLLDLLAAAAEGSGEPPDSVDAAASARIDELDPRDRILVRRASVLGLCFHRRLLRYVLDADRPDPGDQILSRMPTVFADDGDGYIRFKRPALQEVAYEGLPFRLRRQLHAAVGDALEPDLGLDADADPAVLSLHFSLAGDHGRAWKYARLGAERATARFAHADAAQLYRRAIESGRRNGVSPADLAGNWEALGNALQKTGELPAAARAVAIARRLTAGDALAHGRLFYTHMVIAEHGARLTTAVRWAHRGLRTLDGLEQTEAVVWRARTLARLAFYRVRQGRLLEADRLCHKAIGAAKSVGELEAEAYAYYMLDLPMRGAGRAEARIFSERALEIYDRLGDLEQKGNVLNNLGIHAAEAWNWGEALELLGRSAECRDRAGIPNGVAETEVNMGEIMSDRGLYAAAASHLRRALRVWSAIGERAGTSYATALLGRLAIREGRYGDGLELLEKATQELWDLGEQGYAEFAESLLAEAAAFGGDPTRAEALADRLITSTDRTVPLLHRIRAIALVRLGRDDAANELSKSLALARQCGALYDVAAGLDLALAMSWVDSEHARERDEILAQLGIESLPMPPLEAGGRRQTPVPVAAG